MNKLKLMYEYIIVKPRPKKLLWYDIGINNIMIKRLSMIQKECSGK